MSADYWQHQEQLNLQQQIEEALQRAEEHRATTADVLLLAWAAGVKINWKLRKEQHA